MTSRRRATRTKPSDGLREASDIVRFSIPSDFAAGREVQKKILDKVARSGFNDQSAFAIKLALEEALINAIKHGNKLDPGKKVTIEAKVTNNMAEIVIEDQGPGFQRESVPDPTAEENLEKCSGRGILLIRTFMDVVRYNPAGNELTMTKRAEN